MKKIALLIFVVFAFGCDAKSKESEDKFAKQCKELELACRTCPPGVRDEFRHCYFDSTKYASPSVVREDCVAVNVGNNCKPCESIFALNFGGSLSDVTCENFFAAIKKRNDRCDGCIKLSTALD